MEYAGYLFLLTIIILLGAIFALVTYLDYKRIKKRVDTATEDAKRTVECFYSNFKKIYK